MTLVMLLSWLAVFLAGVLVIVTVIAVKHARKGELRWWIKQRLFKPHLLWRDLWWGFLHRTFKRFNKVEMPSLKPDYYDVDHRMLHACFNLLVGFVEREKPFDQGIDWDHTPESAHAAREIKSLYNWWKESYLCRRSLLDDLPEDKMPKPFQMWSTDAKGGGLSYGPKERKLEDLVFPEYTAAVKLQMDREAEWEREEQENLIRLINIRGYLWT